MSDPIQSLLATKTTQPPDPQAIDEAVYEAAQNAFSKHNEGMFALRFAIAAALACDRRLRGTDAHGVDWHRQALIMESERDKANVDRSTKQALREKAELERDTARADLAAARAEHAEERAKWQASLQVAHDQRDRADKERRTTIECGAERIRVLQNEIAAAQATIAAAGSAGETALAPGLTVFQMNDARDYWETQMRALPEGSDAALACLQIANGFKVAGFIINGALKIKAAAIVAAKGCHS